MSRQSAILMAFAGALLLAMLLEGAPLPLTLLAPIAPHHNGTVSDGNQVISAELIESRIVDFRVAYHEILEATKKESHRLSEQTLFLEEMANRYITKYLAENLQPMPLQYRVFRLTMRDGTDIYTRNFVPFGLFKKFSTVFSRSPYSFFTSSLAFLLIIDNHAVVTQDIRGTGKSEGYFDVWRQDGKDGYDTMSWIKSQDWSNGQVFSMGISADGCSAFTQWLEQPSWLKSEWLTWYASNAHDTIYPGGAYRSNLIDNWMGFVCPECIKDIKENEAYSDYWAPVTGRGSYDKITGLTTNWGGWYDIFIETTIDGFNGAQYEGSAAVKGNNFLVVDNGGHCIRGYHPGGRSLLPIRLGFATFGAVRKDENFAQVAADIKKSLGIQAISIFVMGPDVRGAAGNYWTSIPQWPVVTEIPFYLSESNYLSPTAPTGSGSASYAYDPTNPVPTIGGNELFGGCGPQDQTSIEGRSDLDGIQPTAPIDNLVEAHSGMHPHAATPLRNEVPYYQTSHALPASTFSQPAFMATPETSHVFSFSHGLSGSSKRIDQEEHEADIDHYPDEDEAVEGENDDADLGIDNLAENASSENLFPYFSRSYISKPLPKWSGDTIEGPRQKRGFRVSWMGNAVVSSSNSQVFLRQCTTDNIMNRQGLKSRSFANAVMTGQTQSRYRFSDLIEQGYYDLFPEAAHRNLWTFIRYINNCLAETESSYGRSLDMSLRAAIDDFLTEFLSDVDISELPDVYEKIIYCIALGKLDSALSQANHLDNPYFCLLLSQVTLSQAHMETITNLLVALRDSSSILEFNSKLVSILEVFAGNLSNVLQAFPNLPWRVYMALGFRYCVFRNVNIREGINQFSHLLTIISTANTAHKESQVYLAVLQALLRMPFDILAITQYIPSILPFDKPSTPSIHLSWHILNFLLYTTRIDLGSIPHTREEIARVINESVECLLVEKMYDQAIVVYLAWVDAFQGWTTPIDQCERLFGFQLSSSSRYGLEKLECIQPNIWSNLTTIKLDAISKIYQHKMVDAIENLSQLADEQSRELLHLALHHVLRDQLLFVAPDSNCVESSGFVQAASGLLPLRDNYWNLTYQLGAHEEALGSYARCIGGMLISGDYFEVLSSMKPLHEPLLEEREIHQYAQSQTDARSKRILDKHLAREKILRECVSFHYYSRYYEHNVGDMNENNSKYIDHLLANKRLVSLVAQSQARTTSSLHQPGV